MYSTQNFHLYLTVVITKLDFNTFLLSVSVLLTNYVKHAALPFFSTWCTTASFPSPIFQHHIVPLTITMAALCLVYLAHVMCHLFNTSNAMPC